MFYIYQQTAPHRDEYVQIGAGDERDAAIDKAKDARANGGGCVVVTSADNAQGRLRIPKPNAGVVYDSSAR